MSLEDAELKNQKVSLTCFKAHEDLGVYCKKTNCRQWIKRKECLNCTLIAAKENPMTLQEIGEIFGVTRMRICQIEKSILQKISNAVNSSAD